MTSACNIARYDREGNELWHYYYKPARAKVFECVSLDSFDHTQQQLIRGSRHVRGEETGLGSTQAV